MHQRIAPNTFSMEHYSRVFNVLTLGESTLKELSQFAELDSKTIEYLIKNLEQHEIVQIHADRICLNCSGQSVLNLMENPYKAELVSQTNR